MLAHFSGEMGQDLMLVVEFDSEHSAWKNCRNGAFEFNRFFATHEGYEVGLDAIHAGGRSGLPAVPSQNRSLQFYLVHCSLTSRQNFGIQRAPEDNRSWKIHNRPSDPKLSFPDNKSRLFWNEKFCLLSPFSRTVWKRCPSQ